MTQFNKLQQNIIKEEFARTVMIQKAKSVLSEQQFNFFIKELRDYEENIILTESNSKELMYEGLVEKLNLYESTAGTLWQRLSNLLGGILKSMAPDNMEKLENLANEIEVITGTVEAFKETGYAATAAAEQAKLQRLLIQMSDIEPRAAKATAEAYGIPFGESKKAEGEGDVPDAQDMAKNPKAKQAADKIEDQGDSLDAKFENPKAISIWDEIVNAYKYAFAANANMWRNVFGFGRKAAAAANPTAQLQMMMQLMMQLLKMMQTQNVPGEPANPPKPQDVNVTPPEGETEEGEGGEDGDEAEEGEEEEKRPIKVGSIERPIIRVVLDVAADEGVKITPSEAREIAKVITRNLVNQMRANGVEFKGVTRDLKESFINQAKEKINEARLARDWMQKNMKTQSKTGAKNTGVRIGSQWIATAKELFQKIKVNGLNTVDGFQDSMEEMKREPNNYVDFLDIAQDLAQLMPRAVVSAAHSGARRRRDELMDLKKSLDTTLKLYKQFKIVTIKEDGKDPSKFGNITKIAFTREARKKYTELKREVGTVDSKKKGTKFGQDKERIAGEKARKEDKIDVKDMSMASAEKGKVNISKTVAKAVQAGGLDQDVAKKITPILKSKIQKIITRHMDGDVKYLEEKINRYVAAVIKEVKA